MYTPGDYTRVPTGARSGIVNAPAEHRPGPLQGKSGPRRLPPGSRRGAGRVHCVLSFINYPRVPGGSRQGPRRGTSGQITGQNRGIFLAGARGTFKLELNVTRGPSGVKKIDGTWSGFPQVPCGTAKKGQKQPGNSPGRPFCVM